MLDYSQVIDTNTPKLEIVRFCHITLNLRQKLSKSGQNSYKNLPQLRFSEKKVRGLNMMTFQSKMAEHDDISKDSFFHIQKLDEIICNSRPISHM